MKSPESMSTILKLNKNKNNNNKRNKTNQKKKKMEKKKRSSCLILFKISGHVSISFCKNMSSRVIVGSKPSFWLSSREENNPTMPTPRNELALTQLSL